jgi:serine protease Do
MGEKERPFVKEQIVPSKRKRRQEFLKSLGRMFLYGAVFGIAAGLFFVVTKEFFQNGKETENGQNTTEITAEADSLEDTKTQLTEKTEKKTDSSENEKKSSDTSYQKKIKEVNQSIILISSQSKIMGGKVIYEGSTGIGLAVAENNTTIFFLARYSSLPSDTTNLQVTFFEGAACSATLQGKDEDADIAVIAVKIENLPESVKENIEIIKMASSRQMQTGNMVLFLGRANGTIYSADTGIISGTAQKAYIMDGCIDVYPTNIIKSENASGFLVNLDGKLLGLTNSVSDENSDENVVTFSGILSLEKMITKIIEKDILLYCGIKAQDIPQQRRADMGITNGIYVVETEPNSPADHAGIRTGDIIQSIKGTEITSVSDFYTEISDCSSQSQIRIQVVRVVNGEKQEKNFFVRLKEKE